MATVVFFAVFDVVVGFLVPVAVAGRADLTIVVPADAAEEVVLVLSLRSFWRVGGRCAGDLTALGPVPAALVAPLSCEGGLLSLADAPVAEWALPAKLDGAPLRGLDGFNGDIGRDMCNLSGDPRSGECGYDLEFEDFGDKILESSPLTFCETTREEAPAPLARRFGLFNPSTASPAAGAFSLSE